MTPERLDEVYEKLRRLVFSKCSGKFLRQEADDIAQECVILAIEAGEPLTLAYLGGAADRMIADRLAWKARHDDEVPEPATTSDPVAEADDLKEQVRLARALVRWLAAAPDEVLCGLRASDVPGARVRDVNIHPLMRANFGLLLRAAELVADVAGVPVGDVLRGWRVWNGAGEPSKRTADLARAVAGDKDEHDRLLRLILAGITSGHFSS